MSESKPFCHFCTYGRYLPKSSNEIEKVPVLDRMFHVLLSKIFILSPSSLALAYYDWLIHFLSSPGSQLELAQSAAEKAGLLNYYFVNAAIGCEESHQCSQLASNDNRFSDPGWQKWPYNIFKLSFLITEQWFREAAVTIRGVSRHHTNVIQFMTRQWLDMFSPTNFPWLNPQVTRTSFMQLGANFTHGFLNYLDDWTHYVTQQPPVGTEAYKVGENIATTRGKVIYRNQLLELIQYEPETKQVYQEPVFIVPAWIMKYYILDLSQHNSMVQYLVKQGHTVFIISWKNPDERDRLIGIEDYYHLGILESLKAINAIVPQQKVHAVGYCIGGTLLSIAAAAMARDNDDRLKSLTLLATQVDFEEAGELLLFVDESQLTFLEDIMWEQGYLDKEHMSGTFHMLRSFDLIWSKIVEEYMLGKRHSVNDLMTWNADSTRMPYKMHSEYLRSLFLNNDLTGGRFTINQTAVSLTDINIPIFVVSTERDHIAPWHSVYKINYFTDADVTFVLANGGHNAGIVSEPGHPHRSYKIANFPKDAKFLEPENWQKQTPKQTGSWWIDWDQWLTQQSSNKTKPPHMGAPEQGYTVLSDAPGEYVMTQ